MALLAAKLSPVLRPTASPCASRRPAQLRPQCWYGSARHSSLALCLFSLGAGSCRQWKPSRSRQSGVCPAVRSLVSSARKSDMGERCHNHAASLPVCRPFGRRFVFPVELCLPPGHKCHSLRSWHRRQGDTFDRNVRFNNRLSQGLVSAAHDTPAHPHLSPVAFLSPPALSTSRRGTVVSSNFTFPFSTPTRYRYRLSSLSSCLTTLRLQDRSRPSVCLLRCTAATVTVPLSY